MIQFRFRLFFICLVASIAISIPKQECFGQAPTSPVSSVPQPKKINETVFTEPMVARVELRLTIGDKEVDVIEKGDLLTVLEEREKTFLIRTFRGIKGAIEKPNLVT